MLTNDTIAAVATAPGPAAIAIIRLSGHKALHIANALTQKGLVAAMPANTVKLALLQDAEGLIDEALLTVFHAPHSYTGEDVVEISTHGSYEVQQRLMQALIQLGARQAKPGEFTQRAFMNGKLDLTQAEAVADLIASNSRAATRASLHNLKGGFKKDLLHIREQLVEFSALMELELDFAEEDVAFADRNKFDKLLHSAQAKVKELIQSFSLGNVIQQGIKVAIVGKPNAGKSTLLNTLLNEERAIVSDIAGTTRDTIEESFNINGIVFRLVDTAGIRQQGTDAIENIGIQKARTKIEEADVVLWLREAQDADEHYLPGEAARFKTIEVINKIDLLDAAIGYNNEAAPTASTGKADDVKEPGASNPAVDNAQQHASMGNQTEQTEANFTHIDNIQRNADQEQEQPAGIHTLTLTAQSPALYISAKNNTGIQTLKQTLYNKAVGTGINTENTIITNTRHLQHLQAISTHLHSLQQAMANHLSTDLLAPDIKLCLQEIGELTGTVTNEDVLDFVFSKFCIGK